MIAIIPSIALLIGRLALINAQYTDNLNLQTRDFPSNDSVSRIHPLSKRDPSFVAADIAYEGCALVNKNYAPSKLNKGIQMAECYLNSRIDHQRLTVFVPDAGNMLALREFGPYGTCTAYSDWPDASMLSVTPNKNYACFGWTKKGPDHKGKTSPPKFPGKLFIPPPIGCPSNLVNCYSHGVYNPGGKLAALANVKTTFSGLIMGPKDANGTVLWCGACPLGTNWQMQLENIRKLGCTAAKCAKYKYPGVTTLMNPSQSSPLSQSNAAKGSADTSLGGNSLTGSGLGGAGSGSRKAASTTPVKTSTAASNNGGTRGGMLGTLFGRSVAAITTATNDNPTKKSARVRESTDDVSTAASKKSKKSQITTTMPKGGGRRIRRNLRPYRRANLRRY